jgi:LytR cell envelope-related transcriptional attenuator
VDHPAPSPEVARPWRTATLVATTVAGLELVLLVVAGIILLGRSLAPHVHAAAQRQARTPAPAVVHATPVVKPVHKRPAAAELTRAKTQVVVLNGNGVQGAAAEAASLIKARGYAVKKVGNAPRTGYGRTIVMYRPGFRLEAVRFGKDLNVGAVTPLDGIRVAQLHHAQLVMILGTSR